MAKFLIKEEDVELVAPWIEATVTDILGTSEILVSAIAVDCTTARKPRAIAWRLSRP